MQGEKTEDIVVLVKNIKQEVSEKSLAEMEKLFAENTERYYDFLNSKADLDEKVVPEHPSFGKLETRLSELVRHVVNHGTYHRGNITAMLRQQGHPGTPTDYVFYLFELQ
jgi:uncharacterized damage-inducible protein DinB